MPVLLLHEPTLPFESRRLVGVLGEKLNDVRVEVVRPGRVLPTLAALVRRESRPSVIHAFGFRTLALAVTAAGSEIAFTPTHFPKSADVAWLRAAMRYRGIHVVCASDAERRVWVTGGVAIDRCTLIRPGVSSAMPADARQTQRARLGYADGDRVLFTPVPAVGTARAAAVWSGCLLNILDGHTRTLAWSDGGEVGRDRLHGLRERLVTPDALRVLESDDPADGFAACDAILLPPDEFVPPTLIAMAMASGRPIVAHASSQVCEMLEDRHTALLAGGMTPNVLAARLVDLFADSAQARQLADRARAEAYEHFSRSRLVNDYRTLYAGVTQISAGVLIGQG